MVKSACREVLGVEIEIIAALTSAFRQEMNRDFLKQFSRFLAAGFGSAVGHYGLLILLVQGFAAAPVPASVAGALLGALINYLLNYHFTFRSRKRHVDALLKFAFVAVVGLLLNTLLMWIGIHVLNLHYLISQVLTTGLVVIWSFSGNRFWTFYVKGS